MKAIRLLWAAWLNTPHEQGLTVHAPKALVTLAQSGSMKIKTANTALVLLAKARANPFFF